MQNLPGLIAVRIPVGAILMPIGIVWTVFCYKAPGAKWNCRKLCAFGNSSMFNG